jgi:hypothetical protein
MRIGSPLQAGPVTTLDGKPLETMNGSKQNVTSILSLFTSFSTLICCALPTLLVTLGLGAVVASMVSSFPLLITLSRNKEWAFLAAGLMLAVNFYLVYRNRSATECDLDGGGACEVANRWSKVVLWVSTGIYVVGFVVAFLAFPVMKFLGLL